MTSVEIKGLTKIFDNFIALDNINFKFSDGEVTCLLGPSGCGKTTLLRIIAGLETQTKGDVLFNREIVNELKPEKRKIGMVFQYPVVFSGLDVYHNIEIPLLRDKLSKVEIKKRIDDVIDLLSLHESVYKRVDMLDNGTRQKVAVAREVARQPDVLLFDEPITNIDANNKLEFKRAFKVLSQNLKQTTVYVTHDQTEAMTLGDKIALMKDGKIIHYDDPKNIYTYPINIFAGWFLGNPGMNYFRGAKIIRKNGSDFLTKDSLLLPVRNADPAVSYIIGIRPEDVVITRNEVPTSIKVDILDKSIGIGGQYLVKAKLKENIFHIKCSDKLGEEIGKQTRVVFSKEKIRIFNEQGDRLEGILE